MFSTRSDGRRVLEESESTGDVLGQMRHMAYKPFVPDASPVSDNGVQSASRGCRGVEYVSVLPWLGIPVSGYCVCKQKRGVR